MKAWHVIAAAVGLGAVWYLFGGKAPVGTSSAPNLPKMPFLPGTGHLRAVPPPKPVISKGPSVETARGTGHF